jgi:hypothetical protein
MIYTTTIARPTGPFAMRLQAFTLAAAVICSATASPTFARIEVIVREGAKIPLPGAEMTLRGHFGVATLNDHGQVAFRADGSVPGVTGRYSGIWYDALITGFPGALQAVTYAGSPVPSNLGDGRIASLGWPVLNNAGEIALSAGFSVYPHQFGTLLSWTEHGLVAVSQEGNPTAGMNPGIRTSLQLESVRLNDAGHLMFVADTGIIRELVASTPDALVTIAKNGLPAPGTEPGTVFSHVFPNDHAINNLGQVAYLVELQAAGAKKQSAVYVGDIGAEPRLVARSGDPLPGASDGTLIRNPESPSLNDRGQVAFAVELHTPGVVDWTDRRAIFAGAPGELHVVARDGDSAPGTSDGVNLGETIDPVINNNGVVAFRTRLVGPGVDSSNDQAYYLGKPGELKLVARAGQQVGDQTIDDLDLRYGHIDTRLFSSPLNNRYWSEA